MSNKKMQIRQTLAALEAAKAAHAAACAARGAKYRHPVEITWRESYCCGPEYGCREWNTFWTSMPAAKKTPEARAAHAAWVALEAAKAAYRAAIAPAPAP
jgi:hypothetical protein